MMRRVTSGPIRTFSIRFDDAAYDEGDYAKAVAERLETDHQELVVKPDAVSVLPRLVSHYGEPFGDSSALPSFYVCEMARGGVTVALNGDGGDETFIGYDRYRGAAVAGAMDRLPIAVRRVIAATARSMPHPRARTAASRIRRFAEALALNPRRRYARWLTIFPEETRRELYTGAFLSRTEGTDPMSVLNEAYGRSDAPTFVEATVHADVQLYLPDDLLVKMDIASMAHSLELRSPLLDHVLMEYTATLPLDLKLRGSQSKYVLREAMRPFLPDAVLARRKMGFGVPLDRWFRQDLREMAYDVLLDRQAQSRGYFRPEAVRRLLAEHVAGRSQHHFRLWNLLMLELWHRSFIDAPVAHAPLSAAVG
jgi:asparagine synthase (glutamine-hydrolysing)